jgi:lipopolysaccharide/colanic/teichoic acid biosynthesis glycosyltransferase
MPVTYDPKRGEPQFELDSVGVHHVLNELAFKRMIALERRRTERSKEAFLLILFEMSHLHQESKHPERILDRVASALLSAIRDTDMIGWYKDRTTLGVVCTGLVAKENTKDGIVSIILNRVTATLQRALMSDQFNKVTISFHLFPDEWDRGDSGSPHNRVFYPDLTRPEKGRQFPLIVKRVIDIVGSALTLILCTPLLLLIALAIKVSSKGPVLFRQERVGRYGHYFTFLKFRSMFVDNDESIHKEFVTKFIANEAQPQPLNGNSERPYKLAADKRITRVGKLLRNTSMDELPQLFNVLKGEMSLVGPRPPLPYEVAVYETWHRRRLLEAKPGITGLWQVTGRSRIKFDEMVRLDLRYSATWTPWLDLWILLQTPIAVIKGTGG